MVVIWISEILYLFSKSRLETSVLPFLLGMGVLTLPLSQALRLVQAVGQCPHQALSILPQPCLCTWALLQDRQAVQVLLCWDCLSLQHPGCLQANQIGDIPLS